MKLICIRKEAVERIGRNWVGNIYKYRWNVYIKDERKQSNGTQIRINGVDINVKKIFTGTKTEVKRWIKEMPKSQFHIGRIQGLSTAEDIIKTKSGFEE